MPLITKILLTQLVMNKYNRLYKNYICHYVFLPLLGYCLLESYANIRYPSFFRLLFFEICVS